MTVFLPTATGFQLKGVVSFESVLALRSLGEQAISARHSQELVIDLSETQVQDASAVALLVDWLRFARHQKTPISLRFINAPLSLQRMQKLFGLQSLILLD